MVVRAQNKVQELQAQLTQAQQEANELILVLCQEHEIKAEKCGGVNAQTRTITLKPEPSAPEGEPKK